DLGQARDEGVAGILDRREEPHPQVLLGDAGKERAIQRLVFGPDRTHENRPSIPEREVPLPLLRISLRLLRLYLVLNPDNEPATRRGGVHHNIGFSSRFYKAVECFAAKPLHEISQLVDLRASLIALFPVGDLISQSI